jgi:dimethylhistidine N-methyltransferase
MNSLHESRVARVVNGAPSAAVRDDGLQRAIIEGLSQGEKTLPCKYFYDAVGAKLFEEITTLEAYYPTRCERALLETHAGDIVSQLRAGVRIVELGSGDANKSEVLLSALAHSAEYVPVDISAEQLDETSQRIRTRYSGLKVSPLVADFEQLTSLPQSAESSDETQVLVMLLGSTIGNFEPMHVTGLLRRFATLVGPGGYVLIGFDRKKDPAVLHEAYNDKEGVTAAFNLNLLTRCNRDAGTDFDVDAFEHYAFYEPRRGCIEMHLVSKRAHRVTLGARSFSFAEGESIRTERSYKYTQLSFEQLARPAGLRPVQVYSDESGSFSLSLFRVGND